MGDRTGWDIRRFKQKLKRNGYILDRVNGSHYIYKHNDTGETIVINPRLNKMVAKRLEKEHRLR